MFKLCFLLFIFVFANGQPCQDVLSVDLTNATTFLDGSRLFDGVTYPKNYIFSRNLSGELRPYGCLCKLKNCVRKCCQLGSVFNVSIRKCVVDEENDLWMKKGIDLYYLNDFRKNVAVVDSNFGFLFGRPSADMYLEDKELWFLQEDGQLYIEVPTSIPPWTVRGPDKYCIDTFVFENEDGTVRTELDALACFAEDDSDTSGYLLSSTCMLISCVFILATVAVYAWLPELRNLHGRVLMAYLLCLFVGFIFLATMQILLTIDKITADCCMILTFIIYFFLLSAFFWLNIMCFDIWWTFSGKRGLSLEKLSIRARFGAYAAYAFGVPSVLTIVLISLELSELPAHPMLPNLKHHGCFLYGKSKLLYLYGPIVVLCLANMVFFALTALKIAKIRQQTSVLKSKESTTHDQQRNERQRLLLYIKLFIVMGINWLLEVISAIYPEPKWLWRYIDTYNVLIGLIIFIIFVCKRKIFNLIKKRYKHLRGYPMSRTVTASSRTMSSRDDFRMSSVKAANNCS